MTPEQHEQALADATAATERERDAERAAAQRALDAIGEAHATQEQHRK